MLPQLIKTRRFGDDRGWFTESYNARTMASLGIDTVFVQDNHSLSRPRLTLRGLHFQVPPHSQVKLVRCLAGAIYDVVVDLRRGSPSFGRWDGVRLDAEMGDQLLVPIGFGHGFLTLTENAEVAYKTSDFYEPGCDGGVLWSDPRIAVDWPLDGGQPLLSEKDVRLPGLDVWQSPFDYDGQPFEGIGGNN